MKWATAVFNYVLRPTFYVHSRYYLRKVAADKWLEQRPWYQICGIGCSIGVAAYLTLAPLRPTALEFTHAQLQADVTDIMTLLHADHSREFPGESLWKFRAAMLSRLHEVNDKAALRRQAQEVALLASHLEGERQAVQEALKEAQARQTVAAVAK